MTGKRALKLEDQLVEWLYMWATKNEAIDKFGDILLQHDLNDVHSLAKFLANHIRRSERIKNGME